MRAPESHGVKYDTIQVMWTGLKTASGLTLRNRTVAEVESIAREIGYKPPRWYFPWEFLYRRLTIKCYGRGRVQ